ncbi:MAG: excinuclease ABC subunit UvrC [Clostridia bacterium]|nr:excinuclease ABC subunit UvrC [Clostridia bacterium]
MNERIAQQLSTLPELPGVYLMHDENDVIIYVGKARVLKNRVRQYFQATQKPIKVQTMVSHIAYFEYVITPSELDALILESNLIKKYKPQYNILLKDDKHYPYLRINRREPFPGITVSRRLKKDGARYFGPYMGVSVKELLELVHAAYPLRSCARLESKRRPCLNAHMGRCMAPCTGNVSAEAYAETVDEVIRFLSGNDEGMQRIFTEKMMQAAENEEFETAMLYRDRLKALEKLQQKKHAAFATPVDYDVFGCASNGSETVVNVQYVRKGKLMGARNYTISDASLDNADTLRSFLLQFYREETDIPQKLLLDISLPDSKEIAAYLTEKMSRRVELHTPQRGVPKELVQTARKNAEDYLYKTMESHRRQEELTTGAMYKLQEYLHLPTPPRRMECYDISHISGTDKTASMVVFFDGAPARADYRRFRIKTVEGSNDFASMYEALSRRLMRAKSGDEAFLPLPDLLIIDGGKVQLQYAREAMQNQGYSIPIVSLAKRDEEIYTTEQEEPLRLDKSNLSLRLMQRIRDEAHRFAITYHRSLRNKRFESALSEIEGIGPKKRAALYKKFHSLEKLKQASVEELAEAEGISSQLAARIHEALHKPDAPSTIDEVWGDGE